MQTDNAFFADKVALRYNTIKNKEYVKVLDAFAGKGDVWAEVSKRHRNTDVIGIEKEHGKNKQNTIVGDNTKLLKHFDLSSFNVVDLDSYGIPAVQIDHVMRNETLADGTYIFYTCISTNKGSLPNILLRKIGYTKEMTSKAPTLFSRRLFDKFCNFLSTYGVRKVYNISKMATPRMKHYGYFIVEKNH